MGKRKKKGRGRKAKAAMTRRDQGGRSSSEAPAPAEPVDDEVDTEEASEELEDDPADASEEEAASADGVAASPDDDDDEFAEAEVEEEIDEEDRPLGLPHGAPWALPLVRLERRWTWLETRLMFGALMMLTVTLCLWFSMRGLKEPLEAQVKAGTFFRAMFGAAALGGLSRLFTRGRPDGQRNVATGVAMVLGVLVAPAWRGLGIEYWDGVFDWLQQGSTMTLFGGLKGLSTRLTMFVAIVGASLAAASGTHINIDVFIRLLPERGRKPMSVVAAMATALVCIVASWGFLDHLAITSYGAKHDAPAGEKVSAITHELGEMTFALRKQIRLDLGAVPVVLAGDKWNGAERFTGRDWNAFLDDGFVDRYGEEKVAPLRALETDLDTAWTPFVRLPGRNARGFLVEGMDLLWPLGLLLLGLRFVLRGVLIGAGHIELKFEGEDEGGGGGPPGAEDDAAADGEAGADDLEEDEDEEPESQGPDSGDDDKEVGS